MPANPNLLDLTRLAEIRARGEKEADPAKLRRLLSKVLDHAAAQQERLSELTFRLNEVSSRLPVPGAGTVNSQKGRDDAAQ
jgi:hypothetical protein